MLMASLIEHEIQEENLNFYLIRCFGDCFLCRMPFSVMRRHVGPVRTDVSKKRVTSIFRVERMTML
jgi:hypothetical protein